MGYVRNDLCVGMRIGKYGIMYFKRSRRIAFGHVDRPKIVVL